jgi:hypothetical protein
MYVKAHQLVNMFEILWGIECSSTSEKKKTILLYVTVVNN